ncbi:MAG: hypothetical protein R3331_02045 [Sulfurospirillaceae bacterium]|nr:hypothetical protein [Sulfurospirillaceae bacterium]
MQIKKGDIIVYKVGKNTKQSKVRKMNFDNSASIFAKEKIIPWDNILGVCSTIKDHHDNRNK